MRNKKMNKKGFFFVMDGIFAIIILLIGSLIISSNSFDSTTEIPLNNVTQNALELLSEVKLNDICTVTSNPCACSIGIIANYCDNNQIMNFDQSILNYFGELYNLSETDTANELFQNLSLDYDLWREDFFNIEFIIDGETIYLSGNRKTQSKNLLSHKKIIFGYFEDTSIGEVYFWGPYLAEVHVWK